MLLNWRASVVAAHNRLHSAHLHLHSLTLPAEEEERKVSLSGAEREHVSLLRRHAAAAAGLAQAAADAASPLAMSQSLQVRAVARAPEPGDCYHLHGWRLQRHRAGQAAEHDGIEPTLACRTLLCARQRRPLCNPRPPGSLPAARGAQVAVQSFGVCIQALRALAATTEAVELHTDRVRAALGACQGCPRCRRPAAFCA